MNIVSQLFEPKRLSTIGSYTALKWEEGLWTYRELWERIQQYGFNLQKSGIRVDDRVVFRCSDTAEFVAVYLAVINMGAVAIAVSTRLSDEDLKGVLEDSDSDFLICDSKDEKLIAYLNSEYSSRLLMIGLDGFNFEDGDAAEFPTVERGEDDECLWVYSSGSTSRPKGIVHTHRKISACCHFHSDILGIGQHDLIFCTSRLSFAYALANGLLAPLMLGATVYLHPDWVTIDDVQNVIARENPKVVFSVPTIYRGLLSKVEFSNRLTMSRVEKFVSAGEHLPLQIRDSWYGEFGKKIVNVYGCSETLFLAFAGNDESTPAESVGAPLPGVIATLATFDNSSDVEFQQGVLHLSHPFMFREYAKRPEDTSASMEGDNFITGDLYHCDSSNNWFHRGRTDDLVKVSGQWVQLRDIETVGRESGIASDVAVVSAIDNNGMARPAMFFIPSDKLLKESAADQMRQSIQDKLANIQQPSWIRVVEEFPRTVNGKISRASLKRQVEGAERDAV